LFRAFKNTRLKRSSSGDFRDSELDAAAHGIDALRPHPHAIAKVPRKLFGLGATPAP
jgi:hypothetical protein